MSTTTQSTLAAEVWEKLSYWRDRASELYPTIGMDVTKGFVLANLEHGIIVGMLEDFALLHWAKTEGTGKNKDRSMIVNVSPDGIGPAFEQYREEYYGPLRQILAEGNLTVLPRTQVPYGFVVDDTIVAIGFTANIEQSELTKDLGDRDKMGLVEDCYVTDAEVFDQLMPAQPNLMSWHDQFWALAQVGNVVVLGERIKQLTGDVVVHHVKPDTWLEVTGVDGASPHFSPARYVAVNSREGNLPDTRKRAAKGATTFTASLKDWFLA